MQKLLRCSKTYAKFTQIERRNDKLAWSVLLRCSKTYAKLQIIPENSNILSQKYHLWWKFFWLSQIFRQFIYYFRVFRDKLKLPHYTAPSTAISHITPSISLRRTASGSLYSIMRRHFLTHRLINWYIFYINLRSWSAKILLLPKQCQLF